MRILFFFILVTLSFSASTLKPVLQNSVTEVSKLKPGKEKGLRSAIRILDSNGVLARTESALHLSGSLYAPMPFEPHYAPDRFFGTYLIYNVPFKPVNKIKKQVEEITGINLKDRGEAHITVITPPERDAIIKHNPKFSMIQINELVGSYIQQLKWRAIGVGKATNEKSTVYFIVVKSNALRAIRRLIAKMYDLPKNVFDPELQDFHVTVGFTESDVHNVAKDESSLVPELFHLVR